MLSYLKTEMFRVKIRLEEHQKAVVRDEIEKLDMADHIWKEN